MEKVTYIEEYVVPQLFTTAFEAYEFEHRGRERSKGYAKLETFGLLWGYSSLAKGDLPARIVATMSTGVKLSSCVWRAVERVAYPVD